MAYFHCASPLAVSGARDFVEVPQSGPGGETPRRRLVEIVDTAVPGSRPLRPNRPATVFAGLFGGASLALLVGGVGALVMVKRRSPAAPMG